MGQVWPNQRGHGKSSVFLGLTWPLVGGSLALALGPSDSRVSCLPPAADEDGWWLWLSVKEHQHQSHPPGIDYTPQSGRLAK